jgi:hypothetical protein
VGPALSADSVLPSQAHIGFVHQFGGLDSLARAFPLHVVGRQVTKLPIYHWKQTGSRLAVAFTSLPEQITRLGLIRDRPSSKN